MTPLRIVALVLLLGGIAALAWGGFSYTRETHEADIGPIELSVEERETVNIPVWAGVGAIVLGAALLFSSRRPSAG
jgi:TRAP-type C4-dicarboxylate transport system permease small subunit